MVPRELGEEGLHARVGQVVRGLVGLGRVGPGRDLDVAGLELGARLDHPRHGPLDPAVADDGQHGPEDDRGERQETTGVVAEKPFEEEADHVVRPLSASVGLSLAIRRAGRNETTVVTRRTRTVVPATRPAPYVGKIRSPRAKP